MHGRQQDVPTPDAPRANVLLDVQGQEHVFINDVPSLYTASPGRPSADRESGFLPPVRVVQSYLSIQARYCLYRLTLTPRYSSSFIVSLKSSSPTLVNSVIEHSSLEPHSLFRIDMKRTEKWDSYRCLIAYTDSEAQMESFLQAWEILCESTHASVCACLCACVCVCLSARFEAVLQFPVMTLTFVSCC